MSFRSVDYSKINIHNLGICNFPRGILVFSLGLVFFLCGTKQYKAMKIDFTFFGAKWIYCAFPKFLGFSVHFFKTGEGLTHVAADCVG